MASRAYQETPCQTEQQYTTGAVEPDPAAIRQFWDEAKRQVVTGDYLRRKWMPRQGHRFYTLIKVLRSYCSYSIKQGEAPCFPSYEAIAQACHVSRRTICTWMAHDEQGRFTHPKHGEALNRFVRVQPRRRYDPAGQRQVKTSNLYLVRMDDPVIPEEEALIWEKATALAIYHLEHQQEEQKHKARQHPMDADSVRTTSFVERDCTLNNEQKQHSQSSAETAQDRLFSPFPFTTDFHRSAPGEESTAQAIRSNQEAAKQQANRTKDEEDASNAALKSKSNSATAQHAEDPFRHAAPLDKEEESQREEREAALQAAYEAAGGVVYSLLEEFGDTHAAGGTRKVLSSLVAAGAPPEQMTGLAYLARDRVRAFVLRGGRILDTQVGFYITTLCNLAKEARRKGWNLEQIAATDRRRHERRTRQGQQHKPEHTLSQARPQPARPARRRPTPEEAEALVMELGQQEAVYAEAQTQVRQVKEQQQAREARQQGIQQQAQLFSRLAQAKQALTMHPEGSLAWERAQREKQEIERQIAALRQPGGVTATAPATPPEPIPQPSIQDRSEQEYREAIHAWARAHGWTVKHRAYGVSQRDWQIGLMGVSKAALHTLAAELDI